MNTTYPCPSGYYADSINSSLCTQCPAGSMCSNPAASPVSCLSGQYSSAGSITCELCPDGYNCTSTSAVSLCDPGYYSTLGEAGCTACPLGNYCPSSGMNFTIPCPSGYYADSTSSSSCTQCPAGSACSNPAASPVSCPSGQYSSDGSITCELCPAGYNCTLTSVISLCDPGYYSTLGEAGCTACPLGNYCPSSGMNFTIPCPSGYYADSTSSTSCTQCPAGSACSNSAASPVGCPSGQYSSDGSVTCELCPAGYNCTLTSVISLCDPGYYSTLGEAGCTACPLGNYCPSSGMNFTIPCSSGYYADTVGSSNCTVCPAGSKCPDPTVAPVPCNSGYYSLDSFDVCVLCPSGYECTTTSSAPVQCLPGTYAVNGSTACAGCSAGYYCPVSGISEQLPCASGTYANTTNLLNCTSCPSGYKCPDVALTPVECGAGFYSSSGSISCTSCPEGYKCGDTITITPVQCSSGEYAPVGSSTCHTCPAGSYCPDPPRAAPIACPSGWYQTSTGQTACSECNAGSQCPNATQAPDPCAAGYFSPIAGATNCQECPKGTYNKNTQQLSCNECPVGSRCPFKDLDPIACGTGQYSPKNSEVCLSCPAGVACSASSSTPTPCNQGQYSNSTHCVDCPTGNYCPSPSGSPVTCADGTYADTTGNVQCTACPAGYSCLDVSSAPVQCTAGYYSLTATRDCTQCPTGQYSSDGASSCQFCPAGKYCINGTTSISPTDCPTGTYSPDGVGYCSPCALGTYSSGTGAHFCSICPLGFQCINVDQTPSACYPGEWSAEGEYLCAPCPAGHRCPTSDKPPIPCASGTYSPLNATSCTDCPAGHSCVTPSNLPEACTSTQYSAIGSAICSPCPAGKYCSNVAAFDCNSGEYSLLDEMNCTICPSGYSCASKDLAPVQCNLGQTTGGLQGQVTCTDCTTGYYCADPTLAQQPCPSGYYSAAKAPNCTECPAGYYCTDATAPPLPCQPGSYSIFPRTSCTQCPAGYACASTSDISLVTECQPGTYADGNDTFCTHCPAGKYCPNTAQALEIDCTAGSYSTGSQQYCTECPGGWQCPNVFGTANAKCLPGYYAPGNATACTQCPATYACPYTETNMTLTCQPGTYSAVGQQSCSVCPPGYQCPNTDGTSITICAAGTYSVGNQAACTPCPAGFACPNFFDNFVIQCPVGTYSVGNQPSCLPCPPGSSCQNTSTAPVACAAGTYSLDYDTGCYPCPAGSSCNDPTQRPVLCPALKYSNHSATQCIDCDLGYLCLEGSNNPRPTNNICPLGYYCEINVAGIQVKVPCPANTYGNHSGQTLVGQCVTCPAGYFCPAATPGVPTYHLICPRGYYCPAGSGKQLCPDGTYGDSLGLQASSECKDCPAGRYCKAGSRYPGLPCPKGSYCPAKTGATPNQCNSGTYTEQEGSTSIAECKTCPTGHYCTQGTDSPTPCKAGSFNAWVGQGAESDCQSCLAGQACPIAGLVRPTLGCYPGYYCPAGSILPNDTRYACPAGTYSNYNNLTAWQQCLPCPAGQACPKGTGGRQKPPEPCAPGHYCQQGTQFASQFACPAGTYANLTNLKAAADCYVCPSGWYCSPGSATPTALCYPGHYCPAGTKLAVDNPCPAGTYSESYGNSRIEACKRCLPGHYCPAGSSTTTPCPQGRYSKKYSNGKLEDCDVCIAGYSCGGTGNVDPKECGKGNYSDSGAWICSPCKSGHYCNSNHTSQSDMLTKLICGAGMWCKEGRSTAPNLVDDACPSGYYCVTGDKAGDPLPCPNGTYNPVTGRKALSDCVTCPPGKYCSPPGLSQPAGDCSRGHYCPAASWVPTQIPCPRGFYLNLTGAANIDACTVCLSGGYCDKPGLELPVICPKGHFCETGVTAPQPCYIGTYGPVEGIKRSQDCSPCSGGYYCEGFGLSKPTDICDAGFYCREKAYTSAPPDGPTGGLCPAGGYCPAGTPVPQNCPVGTYSNSSGSKDPRDCFDCDPGYYCAGDNNPHPTGPCEAGFYCTGKAAKPTQHDTPAGHYTKAAATHPEPCASGSFQHSNNSEHCIICPMRHYCNGTGLTVMKICDPGHYCPYNSSLPTPCPNGTYATSTGNAFVTECDLCDAGKYCGSWGLALPSGACAAGFYCLLGSATPIPGNSGTDTEVGGVCPAGHFCPEGTKTKFENPCGNGTYNNVTQRTSIDDCLACPPGKACTAPGLAYPNEDCAPGYYCIARANTTKPIDGVTGSFCTEGHYCPGGSSAPLRCLDGTYNNVTHQSTCFTCPAGYFCDGSILPQVCPRGRYCPAGTGANSPLCPPGTYNSEYGLKSVDECLPCQAGWYCAGYGIIDFFIANQSIGLCDAGFYCVSGVNVSKPVSGAHTGIGGVCPPGYYCPAGTSVPKGCPPGTYSANSQLEHADNCTQCEYGKYCSGYNSTEPVGPCDPGFYCLRGSTTPNPPTVTEIGGPCPVGRYCESGTSYPKPCNAGSYNNISGQAICFACPSSFYCPENSTTYSSNICPIGHYCPTGTKYATEYPCPRGYFRNVTAGHSVSDCYACPGGWYCNGEGLISATGKCDAGYFCSLAAWSPKPTDFNVSESCNGCLCPTNVTGGLCPAGYYCPFGSPEPIPCPGGYFCLDNGLTNYTGLCSAGYYCSSAAKIPNPTDGTTGDRCPAGHYCLSGTSVPKPCPAGTFSNSLGNTALSDCQSCTKGYYCNTTALTTPSGQCRAGYYCPAGQSIDNPFPCPPGNYCLAGSFEGSACPPGQYQNLPGQSACKPCVAGYYCDPQYPLDDYSPYKCPAGFYCPQSTPYGNRYSCPNGTYSASQQLTQPEDCTPCDPGKYCNGIGRTSPNANCNAGFYCSGGAFTPSPNDGTTGYSCPIGHYCPTGATIPLKCSAGTFSNVTGLKNALECFNCTAGKYCGEDGLTKPSGDCYGGFFCTSGASTPSPTDGITGNKCSAGHYCPNGTAVEKACLPGTYTTQTQAYECLACPSGKYCVDGLVPADCPEGFFCPSNTGYNWKSCPTGTFSNQRGLLNDSQCESCTAGNYCDKLNATAPSGSCDSGYFCKSGSDTKTPDGVTNKGNAGICPPGSYCLASTSQPQPCPMGTYSNKSVLTHVDNCTLCSYGKYCGETGLTKPSGDCWGGFYCLLGAKYPNNPNEDSTGGPCPIGRYCFNGTSRPLGCAAGTYNNLTGQSDCTTCPAGYYCLENSTTYENTPCPEGYYCLEGTKEPYQYGCPKGYYNSYKMKTDASGCTPCDPGKVCPTEGLTAPTQNCSAGWFCIRGAWSTTPADLGSSNSTGCFCSNSTTGGQCEIGYYCPAGSNQMIPCSSGYYCDKVGLTQPTGKCKEGYFCIQGATVADPTDKITGDVCPLGHYCPDGTLVPVKCGPGTFSNTTGNTNSSGCQLCPAGKYCPGSGNAEPFGDCSGGYYCPAGQSTATPSDYQCQPGGYCTAGSANQIPCSPGTYQNEMAQISCKSCPTGYYCDGFVLNATHCTHGVQFPTICPTGSFCPVGTRFGDEFKCPKGTYNNLTGLQLQSECQPCQPGKYCGTAGLSTWTGDCNAGYYCLQNASTPEPTDGITGSKCPVGNYCPKGATSPKGCPSGTYNPTEGLADVTQCKSCDPGSYCGSSGQSVTSGNCTAGFYCLGNATVGNPIDGITGGICWRGHYCPPGSSSPVPCNHGYYSNVTQSKECNICPAGYLCTTGTDPEICPTGFYCPEGTGINPRPCPPGTFNPNKGIKDVSECTSCSGGYYCSSFNGSFETGKCSAGYFCANGSNTNQPNEFTLGKGGICPAGYYCELGTQDPNPCPSGTFSNKTGLTALNQCDSCYGGYYCNIPGLTSPSGKCSPGYYCVSNANESAPSSISSTGGPCPAGYHCPEGSTLPLSCNGGTYSPTIAQSSCQNCLAGYYCPVNATAKIVCPLGHYCPAFSIEAQPCPVGYYSPVQYANSSQDCVPCGPGQYCNDTGLAAPTGLCAPGYYCSGGSPTNKPAPANNITHEGSCMCPAQVVGGRCVAGNYCPQGSDRPLPCDPGFYCAYDGLSSVSGSCTAGYYCNGSTIEDRPVNKVYGSHCPSGHYCPQQSSSPTPCNPGYYSPNTHNQNASNCLLCTAGYYCSGYGQSQTTDQCDVGYYCPEGESVSQPPGKHCLPGHKCPKGSANQTPCPSGSYQAFAGQGNCTVCPDGYYCDATVAVLEKQSGPSSLTHGVVTPAICPVGYYCPEGTKSSYENACPAGTYSNKTSIKTKHECLSCTPGYYCAGTANTEPDGKCYAGYYCAMNATSPSPTEGLTGDICPQGSYCPLGSSWPTPCPSGTYGASLGLTQVTQCTDCPPGMACQTPGLIQPSSSCQSGYYCILKAILPNPLGESYGSICPPGAYCPINSSAPTLCPPGTYQPLQMQPALSNCLSCDPGYYCQGYGNINMTDKCSEGHYCDGNASVAAPPDKVCPIGTFCKLGSPIFQHCPNGTYMNYTGASSCITCPAGSYCVSRDRPDPCPLGYYCPTGTGADFKPCPPGTFGAKTGLTAVSECAQCPAGKYCLHAGATNYTGDCAAGYYCTSGVNMFVPSGAHTGIAGECPVGHFCPIGSAKPLGCSAGTYNSLKNQAQCLTCPSGYYCPENSTSHTDYPCPAGRYCPAGTTDPNQYLCPRGSYNPYAGKNSISDCLMCPPGKYCEQDGLSQPTGNCSAGYYCNGWSYQSTPIQYSNATDISQCSCPTTNYTGGRCWPGTYCPEGSGYPKACDPGFYCFSAGLGTPTGPCDAGYHCSGGSTISNPVVCPKGFYCEQGTGAPIACPAGYFSNTTGNTAAADCELCLPGQYCSGVSAVLPSGNCSAGYYCPGGQNTSKPVDYVCGEGYYCPEGSSTQLACLPGSYQDEVGQGTCKSCPAGYFCDADEVQAQCSGSSHGVKVPTICPLGYYCLPGTSRNISNPCPAGTFGAITGAKSTGDCHSCPAGKFCNGDALTTPSGDCDAGYYCASGANSSKPIIASGLPEYNDTTTLATVYYNDLCPIGYYCPAGTIIPIPCPAGTFSAVKRLKAKEECSPCPAGQYCKAPGLIDVTTAPNCNAGYICSGNSVTGTPTSNNGGYECPRGYYCPSGAVRPQSCPPGTYQSSPGNDTCIPCPASYQCDQENVTDPIKCIKGHYCPAGVATPIACPNGTFRNQDGAASVSDCQPCSTGKFCSGTGNIVESGDCDAGFYCVEGASSPVPESDVKNNGPCPAGKYCSVGTTSPTPCPPGRYRNTTGAADVDDCYGCEPGYYCATPGLTTPTGQCDAGYYCPPLYNATIPTPPDRVCPIGSFCVKGSALPTTCAGGSYQPVAGKGYCDLCKEGYYCASGLGSEAACPPHNYCPAGSQYPTLCPNGTYTDSTTTLLTSVSGCKPCPTGKFCRIGRITASCSAGYYCLSGSPVPAPEDYNTTDSNFCTSDIKAGPCSAGQYCEEGTIVEKPCPENTIRTIPGGSTVADCLACPIGKKCYAGNPIPDDCPTGNYCPGGAPVKCPYGTYRNTVGGASAADCFPCPAGAHCNDTGISDYNKVPCPPGFYCPNGTYLVSCGAGFMRPNSGAARKEDCVVCLEGYYCPDNRTNVYGIPCDAGFNCPLGSVGPTPCEPGTYCPGQSNAAIVCPAGYYCPAGSADYKTRPCNFRYFCPEGSAAPLTCDLGYQALNTSGLRIDNDTTCEICPAGYYNNAPGAQDCLLCPGGYYCPQGSTNGYRNPCVAGTYCPAGSSAATLCPIGTYGNFTKASNDTDCFPCQQNTFNNLLGQTACRPCGRSATALNTGSITCSCIGSFRSFQPTTGLCVCEDGYVFYDANGNKQSNVDSDKSCQEDVVQECTANQVRLASTKQCVPSTGYDCGPSCPNSNGTLDAELGVCQCNSYTEPSEICSQACEAQSPTTQIVTTNGQTQILVKNKQTNNVEQTVSVPNLFGLNQNLNEAAQVHFVDVSAQSMSGLIVTQNNQVPDIVGSQPSAKRRRLLATSSAPGISNPIMCIKTNEVILFKIALNQANRSLSHYPQYQKEHVFNTNTKFDYGPFTDLEYYVLNTNITIRNFAYMFTQKGVYVFVDAQSSSSQLIVRTIATGENCGSTGSTVVPSSPTQINRQGIGEKKALNVAPNWPLIFGLLGLIGALVLLLVIVVIAWKPKEAGFYSRKTLRPRYKNLGAPIPPNNPGTQIMPRQEAVTKEEFLLGPRALGEGLENQLEEVAGGEAVVPKAIAANEFELENFSVRTLFDKLEDQNVHCASQLHRHQADLRDFYERMNQQNEALKGMVSNLDVSVLQKAANASTSEDNAEGGADESAKVKGPTFNIENKHYTLTGGINAREQDLISTLQKLLDHITNPQIIQTNAVVQRSTSQDAAQANNVIWKMHDHTDLIRRQAAEKIQLEKDLQAEEQEAIKALVIEQETKRSDTIKRLNEKLAAQISPDMSDEEVQQLLAAHEKEVESITAQLDAEKDRQKNDLRERLAKRRKDKQRALADAHRAQARKAGLDTIIEEESEGDIEDDIKAKEAQYDMILQEENLEAAKELSENSNQTMENLGKTMNNKLAKNLESLSQGGIITPEETEALLCEMETQQKNINDGIQHRRNLQRDGMKRRLEDRRKRRLNKLADKHAEEVEEAKHNGDNIDKLLERQRQEANALEARLKAEEAEEELEMNKKLNEEAINSLKQANKDILERVARSKGLDEEMRDRLVDEYRDYTKALEDEQSAQRSAKQADIKERLVNRRMKRLEAAQKNLQEEKVKDVEKERDKLLEEVTPTSGNNDGQILIPEVAVVAQSSEETALKQEQERVLEDLRMRQKDDLESFTQRIERDSKEDESKLAQKLENSKQKKVREMKNKQAAELAARGNSMSTDETAALMASHQRELAELENKLDQDKHRQKLALKEKLRKRKKNKQQEFVDKQEQELEKETLEQEKELSEVRKKNVKEAEKQAMIAGIQQNGVEAGDLIVRRVLEQRHADEMKALEKQFEAERKKSVDDALTVLLKKQAAEREAMLAKHQSELEDLENSDLAPDELEQQKSNLLNKQQLELSKLEQKHEDQRKRLERSTLTDLEVKFANEKLKLKEQQYKEYADALSQLTPEQDAAVKVEKAKVAAQDLDNLRKKLEVQRQEQEEKLKQERNAFETQAEDDLAKAIKDFDKQLEKEMDLQKQKLKQDIEELDARKTKAIEEKKEQAKQELEAKQKSGSSKEELQRLTDQHEKDLLALQNKLDADRMRMESSLQEKLRKRKEAARKKKVQDVEAALDESKREHEEELHKQEEEIKKAEVEALSEVLHKAAKENESLQQTIPGQTTSQAQLSSVISGQQALSTAMPASFQMAAPLLDNELSNLLVGSPLYAKLDEIRSLIREGPKSDNEANNDSGYIDPKDATWINDTALIPLDIQKLNSRLFIVYKFGQFISDLLSIECQHPTVTLLIAEKIPPNNHLHHNAYRNSFYYDSHNRFLYIRVERLENVGEFVLVLTHILSHIKCGDMINDNNPGFAAKFYAGLSVLCDDLFFSRYKTSTAVTSQDRKGLHLLQVLFGSASNHADKVNVVDNLLDMKLKRGNDEAAFSKEQLRSRLSQYSDFTVSSKLHEYLGSIHDRLSLAREHGIEDYVDKKLMEIKAIDNSDTTYHSHAVTATPATGKNMIRQLTRTQSKLSSNGHIGRNAAYEISGAKTPQVAPAATDAESYQRFMQIQISDLEERIDNVSQEFSDIAREVIDTSSLMTSLEEERNAQIDYLKTIPESSSAYKKKSRELKDTTAKLVDAKLRLQAASIKKEQHQTKLEELQQQLMEKNQQLSKKS
ncbi:uncharacterized protein TRIADDRAFT_55968 [Trichoplax adhaerens]|uniref:Uncharacterized protein n=1 Tax=Trichoplax adhaerens TaxID=10228 RepID=B3RTL5_TRIAD|nr:hypothetical protein TRIADDRAFT_55968 [Trichoplax adhaerens]EDV25654.1 hypothetical protein TRIADDRAFT_55968 [Trichoplax adhaerens]|eukprot:XP_002111687.1 hypothetical protein TRIADDRAFT_55968 [Trichoplax adhaerens]